MNKKVKIIIAIVVALIIGLLIFFLAKPSKTDKPTINGNENKVKITISYNPDGGSSVEEMEIEKGTSFELPTTTKEGYTFLGWYKDETKYTNENVNTIENNIVLTAKWEKIKEEEKTLTVIFESNGGNSISNMSFKCNSNNAATLKNLPIPKRNNYTFMTWEDKFGTSIVNDALITCDGDLKLYAVWEADAAPTSQTTTKTYKCPSGYELKDTNKCVKLASAIKYCPDNLKEVNGECVNPSSPNTKGTRYCEEKTYDGYTSTGYYYEVGRGYCGYVEMPSYTGTQSGCQNAGGTYISTINKCFKYIDINYKIKCASGEKLFDAQVIAPGNGGGCYQVSAMKKKCPDGYTNASVYGECALIQNATLE